MPVDRALDDAVFREWLAAASMQPLPSASDDRVQFLTRFYEAIKERLGPFLQNKVPHLKIFRVMAVLYPEGMTTVASAGALDKLTRAMGSQQRLDPVERHVWVRQRLDEALGPASTEPVKLAERIKMPWLLYERLGRPETEITEKETTPGEEMTLVPLPAIRRRRGLTTIRGLFPGVISTLEFVRDGVTRPELIEFLRAASPDAKASSLGISINVLQSELAVIKLQGDRYVLTGRGEDVLESQDPSHLADWILTRILGADRAIMELRERGPLPPSELSAVIQSMNPGWTTQWVPEGLVKWLRSMGVITTVDEGRHALTDLGREWASRIHWVPEALMPEPEGPISLPPGSNTNIALPDLSVIIASVRTAGHFPHSLVERLHAGLWSHSRRHFAVLTGLSGAGKTLLARVYSRAITVGGSDIQRFTLAVQPGWYDPGALLGYKNPLRDDSYVPTGFLKFLMAAVSDPSRPYVAVLDEMNLSHPEQYMAPLLSAMETGDVIQLHAENELLQGVPESLPYPSNLVLIGTVNMDETTHGLSDKVLDRAFVLEFWDVDLDSYPRWGTRALDPVSEARARDAMVALMDALAPARLHFGWRVVDDVLNFLDRSASDGGSLELDAALDAVVYAKVLPKLRGEDGPRFREALTKCEAALVSFGLIQSRAKVAELRHDLESMGSARFWR